MGGSLLGTIFGTILDCKRDPYLHLTVAHIGLLGPRVRLNLQSRVTLGQALTSKAFPTVGTRTNTTGLTQLHFSISAYGS